MIFFSLKLSLYSYMQKKLPGGMFLEKKAGMLIFEAMMPLNSNNYPCFFNTAAQDFPRK